MRIRIKVKYVVLLMLALIVIVPMQREGVFAKAVPAFMKNQEVAVRDGTKEAIVKALDGSTSGKKGWALIREHMIERGNDRLFASSGFDVYVSANFLQTSLDVASENKPLFTPAEMIPYLQDYTQHAPMDGYLVRAFKQLANYYILDGEDQLALQVLKDGEQRLQKTDEDYQLAEFRYYQAKLLVIQGHEDQAELVLTETAAQLKANQHFNDLDGRIVMLKVQMLVNKGDVRTALDLVEDELAKSTQLWDKNNKDNPDHFGGSPVILEELNSTKKHLLEHLDMIKNDNHMSVFSGTILRSDGVPLSNVGVFLRTAQDVNHSIADNEPYQGITDSYGNFRMNGVLPGSYQLALGLYYEQISGWVWPVNYEWIEVKANRDLEQQIIFQPLIELKSPVNLQTITESNIEFAWEKVKGATSYTLHMGIEYDGGAMSSPVYTNIKDDHIMLSTDMLEDINLGVSYKNADDWSSMNPESILAFSNNSNRLFWYVNALNADGKLLSQSNGYRLSDESIGNLPYFYLKQGTKTAADQLVLERKYEEALNAYKGAYHNNNQDVHSLRMIIRLLESKKSFTDLTKMDALKQETLSYQRLYASVHPTIGNLANLVLTYYENDDWSRFNQTYQQYANLADHSDQVYTQSIYAMGLFKQGAWKEAEKQFDVALALDKNHRFIGGYLALVLHNDQSFERASELAERYLDYDSDSSTNSHKWVRILEQLQEEAGDNSDYFTELNNRMEGFLHSKPELIQDWKASSDRTAMKTFLELLLKVR